MGKEGRKMRKVNVGIAVGLLAGGLAWSQQNVEERRPADPDVRVAIENISGTVTVIGWDRDELEVTGVLGKGTKELDISGDRQSWSIEVELSDDRRVEGSDITIRIPKGSRLEIETVSAEVEISEVLGRVDIETISGGVEIHGDPRDADVSTISGRIRLVTRNPLLGGDFSTISGEIELDAELDADGNFDFETVSGDIVLKLSRSMSAEFEIETFSGSIRTQFGVEAEKSSKWLPSEELYFSLGGGGAQVSVSSVSGSVKLLER